MQAVLAHLYQALAAVKVNKTAMAETADLVVAQGSNHRGPFILLGELQLLAKEIMEEMATVVVLVAAAALDLREHLRMEQSLGMAAQEQTPTQPGRPQHRLGLATITLVAAVVAETTYRRNLELEALAEVETARTTSQTSRGTPSTSRLRLGLPTAVAAAVVAVVEAVTLMVSQAVRAS